MITHFYQIILLKLDKILYIIAFNLLASMIPTLFHVNFPLTTAVRLIIFRKQAYDFRRFLFDDSTILILVLFNANLKLGKKKSREVISGDILIQEYKC